ncbi:hypothetical protein AGLY_014842 [Aphis glycines]|uniref:Uncharacterized protein n=1 Tax=Aphis glycines TaxID=307491 RepID=A0A6G0T2Q9_APHGL|nr:hypothetical protein AGLY_014842 [Aphis glycines]
MFQMIIFPIPDDSSLILFSRKLSMTRLTNLLMSSLTVLSLLCLRSKTLRLVRLANESGRQVREFSLSAKVCKLVRHPISDGKVINLLPYKYNSVNCVASLMVIGTLVTVGVYSFFESCCLTVTTRGFKSDAGLLLIELTDNFFSFRILLASIILTTSTSLDFIVTISNNYLH